MNVPLLVLLGCTAGSRDPSEGPDPDTKPSDDSAAPSTDTAPDLDTSVDTVPTTTDTAPPCPPQGPNRRIAGQIELSAGAWEAKIEGTSKDDQFGSNVGVTGDVTGDGLADLLVHSPLELLGDDRGVNYLIPAPVSGLVQANTAGVRFVDATPGTESDHWTASHWSFSSAGDVDGDGVTDLVMANAAQDTLGGGVYIVGGLAGVQPGDTVSLTTAHAHVSSDITYFGRSHAYLDLTDDGVADLAVADNWGLPGDSRIGRVFVFEGPVVGEIAMAGGADALAIRGPGRASSYPPGNFGVSMQTADLNGDGLKDLVVGSWSVEGGLGGSGGLHVFFAPLTAGGDANELADKIIVGDGENDFMGNYHATLGDTDGDGYDDLAAGAETDEHGAGSGSVYLLRGPIAAGPMETVSGLADAQYHGSDELDRAHMPWRGGDLDGDGLNELLVGAWEVGARTEGAVHVLYGALPTGDHLLDDVADATIFGEAPYDYTWAATVPGDMNGDCVDDLVIGSQNNDGTTGSFAGAAYLLLGGTY